MPTDAPDGNVNAHVVRSKRVEVVEDLGSLLKADLIVRATDVGIDSTGMTKAEIIAELEKGQSGGDVDGNP